MNSNQETSIQRTKIIKKRRFNDLIDYFGITIAVLMGTCGWLIFLLPNEISMGGVTGISSILYWGLKIPVDATYFTINAILLGLALKILGFKFCIKTIYVVAVMTVFIRLIKPIAEEMHLLSDQPFMAAILGASFIGISIGICLLCNGSTGGSDVVAAMVNKYHDISLGNIILMCDLGIITSSYFVLRDWEQVLYGYVVLFVTSFCVDNVINRRGARCSFSSFPRNTRKLPGRSTSRRSAAAHLLTAGAFIPTKRPSSFLYWQNKTSLRRFFSSLMRSTPTHLCRKVPSSVPTG